MRKCTVLLVALLLTSGCAGRGIFPAYVDQNSASVGRLQGEVDTLKWALDRERRITTTTTTYMK